MASRKAPQVGVYRQFFADATQQLNPQAATHRPQTAGRSGGGIGNGVYDNEPWLKEMQRLEAVRIANQRRIEQHQARSAYPGFNPQAGFSPSSSFAVHGGAQLPLPPLANHQFNTVPQR